MRPLHCAILGAILAVGTCQQQPRQQQQQIVDPCTTRTKTSAHPSQCDAYYQCFDGQAILQNCPNGLVYHGRRTSGLFGVCDYDFNIDCTDRPGRNPPISTEHCDWLYGIFGHETSCTRYWTCWNGTATEQFCIGGLLYNEETHSCDWPQNVAGCQKHPLCKTDPNANVVLGTSCERYWACQGGYPRLQRCPATLVFDRQSLRCVSPPTVDCDVPSTTPAPEEGPAFRQGGGPARRGGQQQSNQIQGGNPRPVRPKIRRPSARPQEVAPQQQQFAPEDNQFAPEGNQAFPQEQFSPEGNQFAQQQFPQEAIQSFPQDRPFPGNFRPQAIPGAIPLN